ncbi:hypothetical protein SK854_06425 [Lentzea sp. BCCO 10_0061]|uniref:Uncharacterized protein n=1 Tax=Lentzea sokolovensis TaxID=3095429 RepID=A0ABU4URE1_9PSEU|nr:hypothetical protein [Lentzea sp. BCCO 10_0061]MDX8141737.1 hypothetical protein [Lentzea sp. BCCO 10_0061]
MAMHVDDSARTVLPICAEAFDLSGLGPDRKGAAAASDRRVRCSLQCCSYSWLPAAVFEPAKRYIADLDSFADLAVELPKFNGPTLLLNGENKRPDPGLGLPRRRRPPMTSP